MPFNNSWEESGIYRKYSGSVTGEDILQAIDETVADHRYDKVRYIINDFLKISGKQVTHEDIELIAAMDYAASLTNPYIRLAIVTIDPEIEQMLAAYHQAASPAPFETALFADLAQSRQWAEQPHHPRGKQIFRPDTQTKR